VAWVFGGVDDFGGRFVGSQSFNESDVISAWAAGKECMACIFVERLTEHEACHGGWIGVVEVSDFEGEGAVAGPWAVVKCAFVFCFCNLAGCDGEVGVAVGLGCKRDGQRRPCGGCEPAGFDTVPA